MKKMEGKKGRRKKKNQGKTGRGKETYKEKGERRI
jgi:hypothetical protein